MTTKAEISDLQSRKRVLATTLASPIASVIAKYVSHPIDTIKSKIQARASHLHNLSEYKVGHSLDIIKQTWASQGIKGFFPGVTLSAFGSIIAFSAYMTVYEKSKIFLSKYPFFKQYSAVNHLLSGLLAEFFSCIFWLPIDIIKERMQVQSEVKIYSYAGPREAVKKIHNSEGIIGLYRAFGATLVFFGPSSALFFMFYEKLKKIVVVDDSQPSMMQRIVCSAGASATSSFITTPLQMVKLRMQIQRADSAMKGIQLQKTIYGYRNIFHGLYLVYTKEGPLALYKGAGMRVLSVVPVITISMTMTETLRTLILQKKLIDEYV